MIWCFSCKKWHIRDSAAFPPSKEQATHLSDSLMTRPIDNTVLRPAGRELARIKVFDCSLALPRVRTPSNHHKRMRGLSTSPYLHRRGRSVGKHLKGGASTAFKVLRTTRLPSLSTSRLRHSPPQSSILKKNNQHHRSDILSCDKLS